MKYNVDVSPRSMFFRNFNVLNTFCVTLSRRRYQGLKGRVRNVGISGILRCTSNAELHDILFDMRNDLFKLCNFALAC